MAFGSTSGGLFGNTNTNTSGGIFGSNNKSGGLFGSNNTSSGGLFGSNNTSSGGLFGNTNNNTSGGLFGSSNTNTSGGLFGSSNTNTSGGLFGSNNQTSSGGLFGSTNTSGGLFGNSTTSGGGLFGSNNNNKSGGLFGNTNTSSGGGLFGNTNTSGGLFGNTNTSSGGLFGNTNSSGGLFGNTNSSGGLFGNTNTSGSLFGNTSGGMFGNTMNNNNSGFVYNSSNASQTQNPELVVQEILGSYTPNNPKFRFQTVMYMQVHPSQIAQYQKPAELTTEQWERAIRDKPEPDCVPVVVKGFEQLKQRVDHFEAGKKSTEVMLTKLKKTITKMKQDHEAHLSNIVEAKKRQFTLSHRLLKLLRQLAKLRGKNTPLSPEEAIIERNLKEIMRPSGKLHTLMMTRDHVDEILSNMPRQYHSKTLVPDDANMVKIFNFLTKQQEDIGKVLQLISQDLKKAQKMIRT